MNKSEEISEKDCEFCKIVAKTAPAEIIYETTSHLAFFPLSPATKGHTLVTPKQHVRDFTHMEPDAFSAASAIALEIAKKLLAVYSPEGMNMITSAGQAASQSIMHLHIHLVPRWANDEMGTIWPPQRHIDPKILASWADEFRIHPGALKH